MGFVFITNYDSSVTGLTDASVAINNAYHYFAETKGSEHALQFLIDVRFYLIINYYIVFYTKNKSIIFYSVHINKIN